ncbi:MAG: type 4a pilus biogenesis protein PilO [Holophagales bacterium]|nr:type 4a pilus biogenesis protein PilO [Holophagales bacterium]
MAVQTGLEGKPWYIAAAVGAALAGAIVFVVHLTMIDSVKQKISRQERKHAELQQRINEGRNAQKSLPQFREEVGRLELELDKLLRVLPTRRNTEDLLRRLRTLTEQGDFYLLSFTPHRRSKRDFYYDWPIKIRLVGRYHNLALFFDRVSRFARIINIEDLRISTVRSRGRGNRHTINAEFTMKTYLYIEQSDENEGDDV